MSEFLAILLKRKDILVVSKWEKRDLRPLEASSQVVMFFDRTASIVSRRIDLDSMHESIQVPKWIIKTCRLYCFFPSRYLLLVVAIMSRQHHGELGNISNFSFSADWIANNALLYLIRWIQRVGLRSLEHFYAMRRKGIYKTFNTLIRKSKCEKLTSYKISQY